MSEETTADTTSALYEAGKKFGAFGAATQTAVTNKKWTTIPQIIIALAALLMSIISNRSELGDDIDDGLDDQEKADFMGGFKEGYDIEDDDLETKVETYGGYTLIALNYLLLFILGRIKKTEAADESSVAEQATDADETAAAADATAE